MENFRELKNACGTLCCSATKGILSEKIMPQIYFLEEISKYFHSNPVNYIF